MSLRAKNLLRALPGRRGTSPSPVSLILSPVNPDSSVEETAVSHWVMHQVMIQKAAQDKDLPSIFWLLGAET